MTTYLWGAGFWSFAASLRVFQIPHFVGRSNMRNIIAALALALAASLAAAQTSNPSSQPQMSPQSPTASQAQTVTQSPAVSQPGTPQAATPETQGAPGGSGQAPAAGRSTSVEDELQLTAEQKAKLQPIIQEEMTQIDAVRSDASLSVDQKRAKIVQIKQTEFPKIQAVLTPEQQKKLADMQQRAQQQEGGASSAAPASSPSAAPGGSTGASPSSPATPDASQPNSSQPGAPGSSPQTASPNSQRPPQ
jgi:periplasmic protein CpxP/Spy